MAKSLGPKDAARQLEQDATTLVSILKQRHWDEKTGLFYATDPVTYQWADPGLSPKRRIV